MSDGERPWQIRDELGQSMLDNFGVFRYPDRMERQVGIIDGLRERYARGVVVEDKGTVFNSDLTQAIELGYLLDLGACMLQAGLARKESRGAHSRPSDFPERDDENFLKHSITEWVDGGYRDPDPAELRRSDPSIAKMEQINLDLTRFFTDPALRKPQSPAP